MNSPDAIVQTIKKSLVRSSSELAKGFAQAADINDYRNAICSYISTAMCGATARTWFETLGWEYAGVHVASELHPDYVSLTFEPCSTQQDSRAVDYLTGSGSFTPYSFTRFLWPDESDVRDKLISPLEIMIQRTPGELRHLIQQTDRLLQATTGEKPVIGKPQAQELPSIIVTSGLRARFRSAESAQASEALLQDEAIRRLLTMGRIYLNQHFLQGLEESYNISESQLYEAICNTILLHRVVEIDPHTVIFFPLVAGLNRIGVFCFVTSGFLSQEDRTRLQLIAETALSNIYAVDVMLARQREKANKASAFTPLLSHNCRGTMHEAALKVFLALDAVTMKQDDGASREEAKKEIQNALAALKKAEDYFRILEERINEEAFKMSDITPASLQRQVRLLIPPEFADKVTWIVDGANKIRISSSPAVLAEAVTQLVVNGLRAVGESDKSGEPKWCTVMINSEGNDELIITIEDIGPGLSPEQRDALRSEEFKPVPSTHEGGYGIKTACWAIRGFGGEIDLVKTDPQGTVWSMRIPSTLKIGQEVSSEEIASNGGLKDGRLINA